MFVIVKIVWVVFDRPGDGNAVTIWSPNYIP